MREILDSLYSSLFWMTTIFIVVLFLFVGLSFLNPFRNKRINFVYKALMYVLAFSFLILPNFGYYGYASSFSKMNVGKTTLALYETYERGGEGPSESVSRLSIIDKLTGERKDRMYIGSYGKLIGIRNDTLCYMHNKEVVCLDAAEMKELYRIKPEEWIQVSPELQTGVSEIRNKQSSDSPEKPYIELDAKNGKTYWFDPFSKKIRSASREENIYLPEFAETKYQLTLQKAPGKTLYFMTTEATSGGKLYRISPSTHGEKFFSSKDTTEYIEPFLLCIDTLKNFFVFGYYPTTDKNTFTVEAKNFNYQTIWKKTRLELHENDSHEEPKADVWKYTDNILYFSSGGYFLAMEPESGNLLWSARL